jgi:prevent-host-death family protein
MMYRAYIHPARGTIMSITTLTSRQLNQDASKAKKAALAGPVIITDRGRPAHVLLTYEAYKRLQGGSKKIADLLAMPDSAEMELKIPVSPDLAQAADLA